MKRILPHTPALLIAALVCSSIGSAQAATAEWAWTGGGVELIGRFEARTATATGMYKANPWFSTGVVQAVAINDNGSGGVELANGDNTVVVNGSNTIALAAVPLKKAYAGTATWLDANGSTDPLNGYTVHEVWTVKRSPTSGIAIGVVQGTGHQHEDDIASITANNGSGQGVVVLANVPSALLVGDTITLESATDPLNNVARTVAGIAAKTITVTTPFASNQGGAVGQAHWGLTRTGVLTFTMYPRRSASLVDSRYVGRIATASHDAKLLGANCQVRVTGSTIEVTNDTLNFHDSPMSLDCCWVGSKVIAGAVVDIGGSKILDRHVVTVGSNGEPVSAVRTMRNLSDPTQPIVTYKYGTFHSRTQLEVVFGADSTTGDWDLTPTVVTGAALTGQYTVGITENSGFSYASGLATINQPSGTLTDPSGRVWWDNLVNGAMVEYDPTGPDPGANQMWKLTLSNNAGLVLTGGTLQLLDLDPTTRQVTAVAASMSFTLTPQ